MANRSAEMHYLARQVALAAKDKELRLWDQKWLHALPLPVHDKEKYATPDQLKSWVKAGSVYQDELIRFLKDERILFAFEVDDKRGIEPAIANKDNINPDNLAKPDRERKDGLAALIDEILAKSPTLTPTQVMVLLLAQCGSNKSIIVENKGDGFMWEPFNGETQYCTLKNLQSRMYRWKKRHKKNGLKPM